MYRWGQQFSKERQANRLWDEGDPDVHCTCGSSHLQAMFMMLESFDGTELQSGTNMSFRGKIHVVTNLSALPSLQLPSAL